MSSNVIIMNCTDKMPEHIGCLYIEQIKKINNIKDAKQWGEYMHFDPVYWVKDSETVFGFMFNTKKEIKMFKRLCNG